MAFLTKHVIFILSAILLCSSGAETITEPHCTKSTQGQGACANPDAAIEDSTYLLQSKVSVKTEGKDKETKDEAYHEGARKVGKVNISIVDQSIADSYIVDYGTLSKLSETVLKHILAVAITGIPWKVESTESRRNKKLQKFSGDQKAAAWDLTAFNMTAEDDGRATAGELAYMLLSAWQKEQIDAIGGEETVTWLWFSMREICLMAAVMGYDLGADETHELITDAWKKTMVAESTTGSIVNSGKTAYNVLLHCSLFKPSKWCSTDVIKKISEDEYSGGGGWWSS